MSKITAATAMINVKTGEYPVYISSLRKQFTNISFPNQMTEEQVTELGFAVVKPTERPAGDVVTEGTPELVAGVYEQRWDVREFNEAEQVVQLNNKRQELTQQVKELAREAEVNGMYFEPIEGDGFYVQVRAEDKANLLGLRYDAEKILQTGADEQIGFRCRDNNSHPLLAEETLEMCDQALAHIKLIYANKWLLIDQIASANTLAELPVIPAQLVE